MSKDRVYVDTSVIGGCFDVEFALESKALLELARTGDIVLIVSNLLSEELALAPKKVRSYFEALPPSSIEKVEMTPESDALVAAYLDAKVVGPSSENDAHHVALATLAKATVILSWNFRHIVHLDKIKGFNAVNRARGYGAIEIRTPREYV